MKKATLIPYRSHGFTLVEMAVVMLIVALLLGGLVPTLSSQVDQRHNSETRKQLDEIQQALIGFAIINGRLPCPADGTKASGSTNAGIEDKSGSSCNNINNSATGGVIPWVTLGVSETDAWGRRFTYRVNATFASASPLFQLNSSSNLNVGVTSTSTDNSVAYQVPAVIVSHGTNGFGAYTISGAKIPGVTGDESDNADNDNHFVSHDFSQNGFDDIVVWISPNTLMNRMVAAGKLP